MEAPIFLKYDDIVDLVSVEEYIEAVRRGYEQRGNGSPTKPRTRLENRDPPGLLNSYTTILPESGVMGGYVYSAGFSDEDAWLISPLFDSESGRPLAFLDGSAFNTYKTGAVGAVAIDELARDDSETLTIFGSGAQALGQVRAAVEVRDFSEIVVFSPTKEHRESFAVDIHDRFGIPTRAVDSASAAVEPADVIVTATNSPEPVFSGADLAPGTHITTIGQYHPTKREIDSGTIARAKYVVDLEERAYQDAGAFLMAVSENNIDETHIHAELGDIIAGTRVGRENDEEITIFDSGGTAIETIASAGIIYRNAVTNGVGERFELVPASHAYEGKKHSTSDEFG